jgi:putative ABC transport system substrate-binding protein
VRRREFIAGLGGAAAWPIALRAQQSERMLRVGVLTPFDENDSVAKGWLSAFTQALSDSGWTDGRNVAIDYRWADGQYERLPAMAADLVDRRVAVIAASPSPAALAAKAATTTIPIVFASGADPVQAGLVPRLNRPGGNLTGSSYFTVALTLKRLELLLELVPKPAIVALLVNPTSANAEVERKELLAKAGPLGLKIEVLGASTENGVDAAFATLVEKQTRALLLGNDPFFFTRRNQLAVLAARHGIPAISPLREYVTAGGLMSYGTDVSESYRQQGNYVGRILKGEMAADLPVQQPTKFELVINRKAAKALGLTLPETLLVRADEVIE